jgi:hypothetical protein
MTTCGVNTLLNKTHLIADTLISKAKSDITESKLLTSLGMVLESSEFTFNENRLKIWKLRNNLALAYAGDVRIAEDMLNCLHKLIDENVNSFAEFENILKVVATSYTPLSGDNIVQMVGMFIDASEVYKFVLSCTSSASFGYDCTSKKRKYYCIGSGKDLILKHWRNNQALPNSTPLDDFVTLTENFTALQILGDDYYIKNYGTGGIMTGVYSEGDSIKFHEPRIIIPIPVLNGKILWIANYVKIFEYKGNIITLTIRKDKPKLLITLRSNSLSEKIESLPHEAFDLNPRHKTLIWYHYDHRTTNRKEVNIQQARSNSKAFEWKLTNKEWFWGIRTDYFFQEAFKKYRDAYGIKDA